MTVLRFLVVMFSLKPLAETSEIIGVGGLGGAGGAVKSTIV